MSYLFCAIGAMLLGTSIGMLWSVGFRVKYVFVGSLGLFIAWLGMTLP